MNKTLLIFSYDFPPSNGGIARLCKEISTGMKEYYSDVKVLTRKKYGEQIPYNVHEIEIVELSSDRFKCEKEAFQYLYKIKNKQNVDVLCGLWHPEATLAILAGFKNVFILGHGTEFLAGKSTFRKYFWLSIYAKWTLGKVKLNIANSAYTKGLIHQINPKAESVALPLGVNSDFFKPLATNVEANKKFRIATLSRILQFKGYDFIAKTIAALPTDYQEKIEWNIGGIGPYLEELKVLVKQLGIQKQVHFHGFIKEEVLPSFYNSNDIFVLCTREQDDSTSVEGFGLVFLEAQSCGIPVIGTKTGGIADAVTNETGGWLIEQDNKEELSDILIKCIDNPVLLEEQKKLARKRILENCTWKKYNLNLKQLLLE